MEPTPTSTLYFLIRASHREQVNFLAVSGVIKFFFRCHEALQLLVIQLGRGHTFAIYLSHALNSFLG